MDTFYLGTHRPNWVGMTEFTGIPLFISNRTLAPRHTLPMAVTDWALDSGAFSELMLFGRWKTEVEEYVDNVDLYRVIMGRLRWAAPMDWACEPFTREKTGLTVREHQERTVQNYLDLKDRGPFIPVLQGWELDEFHDCVDLYTEAGIDLTQLPLVAVGSVCRRHATAEIGWIMRSLHERGLSLHGFGVKQGGLERYADVMTSADSMAWSFRARREHPLPGCTHKSCANCREYATRWYRRIRDRLDWPRLDLRADNVQGLRITQRTT